MLHPALPLLKVVLSSLKEVIYLKKIDQVYLITYLNGAFPRGVTSVIPRDGSGFI